jgi:hypothetical protein
MNVRSELVLVAAAALGTGCGADNGTSRDGMYQATRAVTQSEPSPDFDIAESVTITIVGLEIEVSTSSFRARDVVLDGSQLTFSAGETWTSPAGDGAATLAYDLRLPDDGTLSGIVNARVVFHTPTSGHDFDYQLSISGTKL